MPNGREDTTIKDMLINGQIRERSVGVLGQDGAQLGIMSSIEANELAQQKNLDLVLISPVAKPPVCKIMNYGKFKYETVKKEKENKKNQRVVELKEVWLSATIDVGDLNTKAKQAQKFITNGDRVRVSIRLRGRQMARPELAMKVMDEFFDILKDIAQMEKKPLLEGKSIAMTLAPIAKK